MTRRRSFYFLAVLVALALFGFVSQLIANPAGIIRTIAITVAVVAIILFIFNRLTKTGPQKHEQRAFHKAAKQSKKRLKQKENSPIGRRPAKVRSITAARKKKDASHLTVIEGKKGKKKNRATF